MLAEHHTQRHFLGELLALLHFGEHWSLVQPAAQVDGEQAEHTAEQERNPPGIVMHLCGAEQAVDCRRHQRADQDARCQSGSQGSAGITHVAGRHMLGNEDPGAGNLPANRRALHDP
ncbi:hypothetical protein D3C81_1915310 [compost metagenome]